jgi:hypothetical protein
LYAPGPWDYWFPTPATSSSFPTGKAVSLRSPSPARLRKRVHPLVSFTPLQSAAVPNPPRASRRRAPSLGSAFPLRDFNQQRRYDGLPLPPPSVLGVSHAPDGLLRHRPCGFISPHSHVQGSPSRGFPPHTAAPPRRWYVPSRRLATVRYWQLPTSATFCRPAPRALLRVRVRCQHYGV